MASYDLCVIFTTCTKVSGWTVYADTGLAFILPIAITIGGGVA